MNKTGVDVKVYLTFEEAAWVKANGRGYIRKLVKADMEPLDMEPSQTLVIPPKVEEPTYIIPSWLR